MKEVDVDEVIAALPDLASLHPTAVSGPFAGRLYRLERNGRWMTNITGEDPVIDWGSPSTMDGKMAFTTI